MCELLGLAVNLRFFSHVAVDQAQGLVNDRHAVFL